MDMTNLETMTELFRRIADAAKADESMADHVREALASSGLLDVFGAGESLDVVDLLDMGGEDTLRARLRQLKLTDLKRIVSARQYDPENESARWRSPNKFIDLIVTHARQQLDEELAQQAPAAASWML